MAFFCSSSFEGEHNFYIDPEIYHLNNSAGNFAQSVNHTAKILSFPTKDCGAYAASLPTDGAIADSITPFSIVPSWMESGDDIYNSKSMELKRPIVTSTISSDQVSKFWELYQAYPKYLKNVQKRQKRRNKKKAVQA